MRKQFYTRRKKNQINVRFMRILAITIVLTLVASTANAGIMLEVADSPTISDSMSGDSRSPDPSVPDPVLTKNLNGEVNATDFDSFAAAPAAVNAIPQEFVFYLVIQGRETLFNSNLPLAPDLDGLLKPPQGSRIMSV